MACNRCGQDTRWVDVEGEGRVALDAVATLDGPYLLDPLDKSKGTKQTKPGLMGFQKHDDTCPALKERET